MIDTSVIIALIILTAIVISFTLELLPTFVIALGGCLAFCLTGILPLSEAFSGFSNDTVIMVIGVMIIGSCLFETGAAGLLGKTIIKWSKDDEKKILVVLVAVSGIMSAFVNNSAVVAMFLPMLRSVAVASKGEIKASNLVMPMSIAAMVGGSCTIIGSTPQLVALALLESNGLRKFTFFELGLVGAPILLITILYFATFGYKIIKKITKDIQTPEYMLETPDKASDNNAQTILTPKMMISIVILLFVVIALMFGLWSNGIVAMIGALLCIATGCINQTKAFKGVNWASVFIIAAALGIGKGMTESGAASFLAHGITRILGPNPSIPLFIAMVGLLCVFMANFFSHTSAVAVLAPVFIACAYEIGIDPVALIYCVCMFISIGMMTPLGTASHTMTMSEGYKFKDYFKVGWPLNLAAYLVIIILCLLFKIK